MYSIADILSNFTHILTAILLRCYARLGRRHCDVTGHLACPQRLYGAFAAMLWQPVSAATSLRLFWACSKLGGDLGDLGDLTAICSAATGLYRDLTTTQRRSAAIWQILQIAARSPSCVTGVLVCAILPTWRNARLKPYARYYPPLPYAFI